MGEVPLPNSEAPWWGHGYTSARRLRGGISHHGPRFASVHPTFYQPLRRPSRFINIASFCSYWYGVALRQLRRARGPLVCRRVVSGSNVAGLERKVDGLLLVRHQVEKLSAPSSTPLRPGLICVGRPSTAGRGVIHEQFQPAVTSVRHSFFFPTRGVFFARVPRVA